MLRIGLVAAAAALAAPAWGQALGPVLERLAEQGYGGFEVEREGGTLKVEGVRDGIERELVYDAGTGRLLKDSTRASDDRTDATGAPVAPGRYASLYRTLTGAGYTNVKIEQDGGRLEVDAVKDGQERDLTYDARTGALISSRVDDDGSGDDNGGRVDRDDRTEAGDDRDDRSGGRDDRDDSGGSGDDDRSGRGGGHDDDDDGDDDRGGSSGRGGDDDGGHDDDDRGGSSGRGGDDGDDDGGGRGGRGGDDSGGRGGDDD